MTILDTIKTRYSVRKYEKDLLSRERLMQSSKPHIVRQLQQICSLRKSWLYKIPKIWRNSVQALTPITLPL